MIVSTITTTLEALETLGFIWNQELERHTLYRDGYNISAYFIEVGQVRLIMTSPLMTGLYRMRTQNIGC